MGRIRSHAELSPLAQPDGCYFFTLVTFNRREWLCEDIPRLVLRESFEHVQLDRPFTEEAWVLLPDHYHCIWSLSGNDDDYSTRWKLINPVKHGLCKDPADWPYSSYRRYLELGRAQLTGPVAPPRDFGEWD